jgi:hypothetical protein
MKKVVLVVLVAVLVAVGFAYAAANTVPVTGAGDGQAAISGYNVTNVQYILDTTNPDKINTVKFSLSPLNTSAPAPTTVRITLESDSNATWFPCTAQGQVWSCSVNNAVTVLNANQLRVVAAQ